VPPDWRGGQTVDGAGGGEMGETRLGIIAQTATRFGPFSWLRRHDRLAPLLGFLRGRGIAHINQQRFDLRLEVRGDFLL